MIWDAIDRWMTTTPLILLGMIVLASMGAAVAAGIALQNVANRRDAKDEIQAAEGPEGIMASAILGLLALLMGFTFAIVLNRFEDRRVLVLEEANAIRTVYLRAQLLEQPHRARITHLLVDYTDVRVALAQSRRGKNADLIARNDRLVTQFWAATIAAYPSIKEPGLSNRFLECMNGLIDLDTSRKMSRVVHVPVEVFLTLFVFLVATSGLLGYLVVGRRGRAVLSVVVVLLSAVLIMILDADRPNDGGMREDQRPLMALRASLQGLGPGAFDEYLRDDAKNTGAGKASGTARTGP